jgi:hypothetical protein
MKYRGVVETLYGICMKDLGNTTKTLFDNIVLFIPCIDND